MARLGWAGVGWGGLGVAGAPEREPGGAVDNLPCVSPDWQMAPQGK